MTVERLTDLSQISRRALVGGAVAGGINMLAENSVNAACLWTAKQAEGPFYPEEVSETDWDMTNVVGGTGRAFGEVIEVSGQVRDSRCHSVGGCTLEIWQANARGRYAHLHDTGNSQPLDHNFQGYARIVADGNGNYRFVTIVPGSYPANGDWIRPPHIHFKVKSAFSSLTTQMYFDGNEHNDQDYLLNGVALEDQRALLVKFDQIHANGMRAGKFDLVLADD